MHEYLEAPRMNNTAFGDLVERFALQAPSVVQGGQYKGTPVPREYIDALFKLLGCAIDNESGYAEPYKDVVHEDTDPQRRQVGLGHLRV